MRITKSRLREVIRQAIIEFDGSRFGMQFISPGDPDPAPLGVNDPDPVLSEEDIDETESDYDD